MRISSLIFIGLMLMSFYFGAGNLIYPPVIGYQSGDLFFYSTIGFVTTAALLPLLALIAVTKGGGRGAIDVGSRVHPIFAIIFAFIIYLAIGPLFAIPRAINVGYDLGVGYLINGSSDVGGLGYIIFLVIYILICIVLALAGSKIVDVIGKVLSPLLIIFILIMVFAALYTLTPGNQPPIEQIAHGSFAYGAIEGYGTLDALASYAFGVVIINAVAKEDNRSHIILRNTAISGIVAVTILGILYFGLSYIGWSQADNLELGASGANILKFATTELFGEIGQYLFATIVLFATITTVVGLCLACGEFFHQYIIKIIPNFKINYSIIFIAIISTLIAAIGLSTVIKASLPALLFIYPFVIVLTLLTVFDFLWPQHPWVYRLAVLFTLPFATIAGLNTLLGQLNLQSTSLQNIIELINNNIPFASIGLDWVVPAIIGVIIGRLFGKGEVHVGTAYLSQK